MLAAARDGRGRAARDQDERRASTPWTSSSPRVASAPARDGPDTIEALLDAERRRDVGRRIVEGYTATPQTDEEVAAATEAAIASIEEEPW